MLIPILAIFIVSVLIISFINYRLLDSSKDFFLPALTVQSIVENAIKHGIGKREGGGTVKICTSETDNGFLVIVSDDGVGFEYDKAAHNGHLCIGINNVRQRLSGQCGGSLEIKSRIGTGTTVTILIPKS